MGDSYSYEVVTPKVDRAYALFQPQVELHLGRLFTACSGEKDGLECVLQRFTAPDQNTPSGAGWYLAPKAALDTTQRIMSDALPGIW